MPTTPQHNLSSSTVSRNTTRVLQESETRVLHDILGLPTAPFHEHRVLRYIRRFATARDLSCQIDEWGNLYVSYQKGPTPTQPIVLEAHTDHPGFHVVAVDGHGIQLQFLGKVPAVSLDGVTLQVLQHEGSESSPATITSSTPGDGFYRPLSVTAEVDGPVRPGDFAIFDLPPWTLDGYSLSSRAHDDLAQVAAILVTLDRLTREGTAANVTALFTRAEEVGFVGANGATRAGLLPDEAVIIVLECSGLPANRGFVVRCADLTAAYDGWATTRLLQLADAEAARDPAFTFQTPLPRRGTCNASLFAARGYAATGLTLPMQNYHNWGDGEVRQETIDIRDWVTLTDFLNVVCTQFGHYRDIQHQIRQRMDRLWDQEKAHLLPSP